MHGSPKTLYFFKLVAHPLNNLSFDAGVSAGNSLLISSRPEFLDGLRIPGTDLTKSPAISASLNKELASGNSVGATYLHNDNRAHVALTNSWRLPGPTRLSLQTESGYDLNTNSIYWSNRAQYAFDATSSKIVSLDTRYEDRSWQVTFRLSIGELFAFDSHGPSRTGDRLALPDNGGVHGRVFIDFNANGMMDPGEPGLGNVTVRAMGYHTVTDRNGYFVIPGLGQDRKFKVFLDLDTVPAVYSPTNGIQTVMITPGVMAEINLGVTPVISMSGLITLIGEKGEKPIYGVRFYALQAKDGKLSGESFTGKDGAYYIGELRPGSYVIHIAPSTLPPGLAPQEFERSVTILPDREPQDVKLAPFKVVAKKNTS